MTQVEESMWACQGGTVFLRSEGHRKCVQAGLRYGGMSVKESGKCDWMDTMMGWGAPLASAACLGSCSKLGVAVGF